jgi:hypothetical protein
MTAEDFNNMMQAAASIVKLTTGCGNNAAWMVALEAHDHIKSHRNYRHRVKALYKQALEEFHAYERRLLHATQNRMFHMADMTPDTRKIYGNISDREYYDFWASTGATAYQETRPLVTSLVNKYRLSLINHGIEQPEKLAWPMAALACLEMAVKLYDMALDIVVDEYGIPRRLAVGVFGQFSLARVLKSWTDATVATEPAAADYRLEPMEARNITLGVQQLKEAWFNPTTMFKSTAQTMKDYDDVFRTKGELKKALREVKELQTATEAEISAK